MRETSPLRQLSPIRALGTAAVAVGAFHLAYEWEIAGGLVAVYLVALYSLAWVRTARWAFYLGLAIGFAVTSRSQVGGICELVIQDRINPNTACEASLVRLPGIGTGRAGAIIEYRQKDTVGPRAFNTAEDLQNIKGIGPKTAGGVEPYLRFD